MVNEAGLKAGMINYLASFPPEPVLGLNMPRIVPAGSVPYEQCVWPREVIPEVADIVESAPPAEGPDEHIATLNRRLGILTALFKRFWDPSYSFFSLYTHTTDDAQHTYWCYAHPERFRESIFEPSPDDLAQKHDAIGCHWETVEPIFEHLNANVDPNTVVLVVSDHGMEAASAPDAHVSLNRLLARLGLLEFGHEEEVDLSSTLVYWPKGSDIYLPATGLCINRQSISSFKGAGSSFDEARAYVIDKLRAVRLTGSNSPLLSHVCGIEEEPNPTYRNQLSQTDISVHLSAHARGTDLKAYIDLDGQTIPLIDVMNIKTIASGAHHPRGVILARGGPFRRGPVFGRPTVETPLSDLLQRMHGRSERLDRLMEAARFLGIIDGATTLDITPTMLYLLGLPVADYMDGRVLVEGISQDHLGDNTGTLIAGYASGALQRAQEGETELSPEELERLRSLGYVD
jgi:hypothetical protein